MAPPYHRGLLPVNEGVAGVADLDKRGGAVIMSFVLDAQLFHWLYGWLHELPWLSVMKWVSHLGDPKVALVLAVFGALETAFARAKQKRVSDPQEVPPLATWLGFFAGGFMTNGLKTLFNRPRPCDLYPRLGLVGASGGAFPSGHATMAFAIATALSFRWPKGRIFWFGIAILVGLSRIGLGVHWPSDVLAGALIGVAATSVLAWIERRLCSWIQR